MFRLRDRTRRQSAPPVILPEEALRPGEDDRALVAALTSYLWRMRHEAAYGWSELEPMAVEAGMADAYLSAVERAGHAGWLALADSAALLRAEVALALAAPDFAALHAAAANLAEEDPPDAEALAELDALFFEQGGRAAVDPALAGLIAGLPGLRIVPAGDHEAELAALCADRPEAEARRRDLLLERLERRLADPFEAGIGIVLGRAAHCHAPFRLAPGATLPRDDGRPVTEWRVEAAGRPYRAVPLTDRVALRIGDGASGWRALGHLERRHIATAIDWARRGHVAQAALLGLEHLELADRAGTLVFDSQRTLRRTGAEAAAFRLGLVGEPHLAVVVLPNITAIVDPATNGRLAEFHRTTLAEEAAAHRERLAALS